MILIISNNTKYIYAMAMFSSLHLDERNIKPFFMKFFINFPLLFKMELNDKKTMLISLLFSLFNFKKKRGGMFSVFFIYIYYFLSL